MKGKLTALKILLPVFVVLMALLLVLELKLTGSSGEGENAIGEAFAVFFIVLLNMISGIAMAIGGVLLAIATVLLFTLKNKAPAVTFALVILFLLIPFVIFSTVLDFSPQYMSVAVPIVAVAALAADIASIVTCIIVLAALKHGNDNPAE